MGSDAEELRRRLQYDPLTGRFTWLLPASNRAAVGAEAGHVVPSGYRIIGFQGCRHNAARLAVLYMTGSWPSGLVDHRNRIRGDDRWENLREASFVENAQNASCHRDNRSGFKGVHRHLDGRWRAQLRHAGKRKHIGVFDTPEEAHQAYVATAFALFGDFATGGVS